MPSYKSIFKTVVIVGLFIGFISLIALLSANFYKERPCSEYKKRGYDQGTVPIKCYKEYKPKDAA